MKFLEALKKAFFGGPQDDVSPAQETHEPVDDFWQGARLCPFDALSRLARGDYDGARLALQKIAYIVHAERKKNPDLVRRFTHLMVLFTREDPLYQQCMALIRPVVAQNPGIRQTSLYPHLPVDPETARYVLYFAHESGDLFRVKKGNSYEVYPSDPSRTLSSCESEDRGNARVEISLVINEDETAPLLRQATAYADAKAWDDAIAVLYKANEIMQASPGSWPIATWLKLPLYLQRAGRFDESMRVFDQIDAETPARIARSFGHQSAAHQKRLVAGERERIAEKKALAMKREAAPAKKRPNKNQTA